MTTIHLTIHLPDDDALTPDEADALLDGEVFPVPCWACRLFPGYHPFVRCPKHCTECLGAGPHRPLWEPCD